MFAARHCSSRCLLSSCVRLSVRHKPVLYRDDWMNRTGFWFGGLSSGGFRGVRGVRPHPPLASFRKIHGLPISKTVRTADSTIIIITNFYLAASSHEIFLTVGEREGMKGFGALQRHQLPHPPCKNPGSATGLESTYPILCCKEIRVFSKMVALSSRTVSKRG